MPSAFNKYRDYDPQSERMRAWEGEAGVTTTTSDTRQETSTSTPLLDPIGAGVGNIQPPTSHKIGEIHISFTDIQNYHALHSSATDLEGSDKMSFDLVCPEDALQGHNRERMLYALNYFFRRLRLNLWGGSYNFTGRLLMGDYTRTFLSVGVSVKDSRLEKLVFDFEADVGLIYLPGIFGNASLHPSDLEAGLFRAYMKLDSYSEATQVEIRTNDIYRLIEWWDLPSWRRTTDQKSLPADFTYAYFVV